jgi:hypothetical protein
MIPLPGKINRRKALWVVGGVVVAGLLMGLAALRSLSSGLFSTSKVVPTAPEFSKWTGLQIPGSGQNWQAYAEGWQDWFVQARFEMPASELAGFLQGNNLEPSSDTGPPDNPLKQSWFKPGSVEVYEVRASAAGQASTKTGFYPKVYVENKGSTVVIYITAFNT